MRRNLSTRTKMSLVQLLKSLKANVILSQFSWKAVPQLQTCSCKTPVSVVAVCSSHQHTSLMWQNAADDDDLPFQGLTLASSPS